MFSSPFKASKITGGPISAGPSGYFAEVFKGQWKVSSNKLPTPVFAFHIGVR